MPYINGVWYQEDFDQSSGGGSVALNAQPETSIFGGFGDTVSNATQWISGLASTGLNALSGWEDFKLGREINTLRTEAIKSELRAAPTAVQAGLPSLSQMAGGADGSAQSAGVYESVRNAVLAGSASKASGDLIFWGALGVGAYLLFK